MQVDTRIDVQKVLERCDILPSMDKKLDEILGMTRENSQKLDQVLQFQAKENAKQKASARKRITMAACEIEEREVIKGDFIAEGGQGKVYKATYADQPAAMKTVKLEGSMLKREKIIKNFVTEIDLTVRLRHPNIIAVFGVITTNPDCLIVIMDYAPDGSLRNLLDQVCSSRPLCLSA